MRFAVELKNTLVHNHSKSYTHTHTQTVRNEKRLFNFESYWKMQGEGEKGRESQCKHESEQMLFQIQGTTRDQNISLNEAKIQQNRTEAHQHQHHHIRNNEQASTTISEKKACDPTLT